MIDRSHEIDYKLNTGKPTCAACGATGDALDNPCAQSLSLDEALTQIITEAAISTGIEAIQGKIFVDTLLNKLKTLNLAKRKGSHWDGKAVGIYRTTHTGIAVESFYHPGSVQIYPINALFTWRVKK